MNSSDTKENNQCKLIFQDKLPAEQMISFLFTNVPPPQGSIMSKYNFIKVRIM